ncbi:MAG: hypothetical protein HY019_21190 [Aquabacterium sp.]|nr:hypothetical protein [Aquabacterium sp.]
MGFTTFKRYAIYLLGMLLVKHVMAEQNTGYMDPIFTLTLFQVSVPFSNRMARHDGPLEGQGGHAMRKSKFTEEQMAYTLKQAELGISVYGVCRKMGISSATFYK